MQNARWYWLLTKTEESVATTSLLPLSTPWTPTSKHSDELMEGGDVGLGPDDRVEQPDLPEAKISLYPRIPAEGLKACRYCSLLLYNIISNCLLSFDPVASVLDL